MARPSGPTFLLKTPLALLGLLALPPSVGEGDERRGSVHRLPVAAGADLRGCDAHIATSNIGHRHLLPI